MKLRSILLGAALAASVASGAQAGAIVSAVGAVIDAGGPGFGSIADTYNQNGLSTGYTSGVTDFATYLAGNPTHTSTFSGFEWFSNNPTDSAQVTYDLGSVMTITSLALWNEESSGIGHLVLSTPGGIFAAFDPIDNPLAHYPAQVFSFGAITTRYVTFAMSRCPQPNPGSFNACAIGEVAFEAGKAGVPEPATWALMIGGFGLAGAALRRRRALVA